MEEESASSTSISVNSFVAARAKEIVALSLQITASNSVENKGLAFQHLPKHLRRRAVSHNVKRLPKRLQQAHTGQLTKSSGGPKKKPKKPSRKFRRRKSNLLSEYNRRQRSVKWLETHIWHAKRFHIQTKWNHRIPISPCDKGYRAIYRAFRDFSAMRDISFYSCLEISGPQSLLCERFRRITFPSADPLGIGARYYTSQAREGTLHIYADNQYPFGYIGEVTFFWVQEIVLWLWVHPGYKGEVIDQLENIFNLSPELELKNKSKEEPMDVDLSIDQVKLIPKSISKPLRWSSAGSEVVVTDLYGGLNRLRLIGEETFSILKKVLHVSKIRCHAPSSNSKSTWFQDYFKDKSDALDLQELVWDAADHAHDFPCHSVLPLVVRDPRQFIPERRSKWPEENERTKATQTETGKDVETQTVQDFNELRSKYLTTNVNPLSQMSLRTRIVKEKMSDTEFSKRRGQLLIPGSDLNLKEEENQVPILLIRQAESGWDLILPAGWAMAFWISLSYRCVRPFGHRDALHYAFEYGTVHSPELPPPDSSFGQHETDLEGEQARGTFFSYPPAKRQNLVMLKCPFPFKIDWNLLLNYSALNFNLSSDSPPSQDMEESDRSRLPTESMERFSFENFVAPRHDTQYYVLRDIKILQELSRAVKKSCVSGDAAAFKYIPIPNASRCLIGIGVKMVGKGKPSPMSIICLPEDVSEKSVTTSEEPKDCSAFESERKVLRQQHQKEMAFLRKKRKKIRRRGCGAEENVIGESVTCKDFDSTELSRAFNSELQSLHIPHSETMLREMSRAPFGVITFGGDTYRVGKSGGFGYVTYLGLVTFLKNGAAWRRRNIVLVRDATKSLEFRQATIEVFEECI